MFPVSYGGGRDTANMSQRISVKGVSGVVIVAIAASVSRSEMNGAAMFDTACELAEVESRRACCHHQGEHQTAAVEADVVVLVVLVAVVWLIPAHERPTSSRIMQGDKNTRQAALT